MLLSLCTSFDVLYVWQICSLCQAQLQNFSWLLLCICWSSLCRIISEDFFWHAHKPGNFQNCLLFSLACSRYIYQLQRHRILYMRSRMYPAAAYMHMQCAVCYCRFPCKLHLDALWPLWGQRLPKGKEFGYFFVVGHDQQWGCCTVYIKKSKKRWLRSFT